MKKIYHNKHVSIDQQWHVQYEIKNDDEKKYHKIHVCIDRSMLTCTICKKILKKT